nr:hypothetical protein CFP56_54128 [Quercus suber]
MDVFFVSGDGWEFVPGEGLDDAPKLLCSWETLKSSVSFNLFYLYALNSLDVCDAYVNIFIFAPSIRPHLKRRYHTCVEKVREYLEIVKDFNELISPQYLFLHFLGPEPSKHVRRNVEIVKKKLITSTSGASKAKKKDKAFPSSSWDDAGAAMLKAHEVISVDDLSPLRVIPSHELMPSYVDKVMQVLGESLYISGKYLDYEGKLAEA